MNINDRVYHKGIFGNGIVKAKREGFQSNIGVEFFWLKYKPNVTFHNLGGALQKNSGLWCEERNLVLTPKPRVGPNKVTISGKRSLERLIRNITEIPRRVRGDNSNIVINYGVTSHGITRNTFCLNRHLILNKYEQCLAFARDGLSVPEISIRKIPNAIRKPFFSFGGFGIEEGENLRATRNTYFQKKVNKDREFRAHIFLWNNNKMPFVQEKVVQDKTKLCWNKHQGGEFKLVYSEITGVQDIPTELLEQIKVQAVGAVKALQLDFGGVDLALDTEGKIYLFEVNTRCGLKEKSLVVYKTMFWKLHRLNIERYKQQRWLG